MAAPIPAPPPVTAMTKPDIARFRMGPACRITSDAASRPRRNCHTQTHAQSSEPASVDGRGGPRRGGGRVERLQHRHQPADTGRDDRRIAQPGQRFTAVTEPRAGSLPDGTEWSVQLPQVRGGDRQIRAAFNGKFEAILQVLTGAPSGNGLVIGDGSIGTAERSRAIIGDRTLSGVVIVMANARQVAHPSLDVETAVFNALTGEGDRRTVRQPQCRRARPW